MWFQCQEQAGTIGSSFQFDCRLILTLQEIKEERKKKKERGGKEAEENQTIPPQEDQIQFFAGFVSGKGENCVGNRQQKEKKAVVTDFPSISNTVSGPFVLV